MHMTSACNASSEKQASPDAHFKSVTQGLPLKPGSLDDLKAGYVSALAHHGYSQIAEASTFKTVSFWFLV